MLHIAYIAGLFDGEGHAILQWRKGQTGATYVHKECFHRIKRRQAELLLEFRREVALTGYPKGRFGGKRIPDESRARRAAIREELRQLNGYCWNKKRDV